MRIEEFESDDDLLIEVGARTQAMRLALNITQQDLARQVGVTRRTIERMESGESSIQLRTFLGVCRALGILDRVEVVLPAPSIQPIELVKLRGKRRQRASRPMYRTVRLGSTSSGSLPRVAEKTWTWDEKA